MSDSKFIECPECGSEQPKTAPFCQNCGFRIRAAETMREMAIPMSRDKLDEYLHREEGLDASTEVETERPVQKSRPARQMVAVETEEEQEAVSTPDQSAERSTEMPARGDSHTLMEGLKAVSQTVAMEAVGGLEESEDHQETGRLPAVETSASRAAPTRGTRRTGRIVVATVVMVIASVVALSWMQQERVDEQGVASAAELSDPHRIEIEEGPFRRGLDDEAQSFIMQLCQRMHPEPGENCERDRLLDGEFPRQTVRMPAFSIDSGAVRNGDYQKCVDAQECPAISYDDCHIWTPQGRQIGVRMPRALKSEERPVVCVDQQEAQTYCRWKEGDLPTHNQWEKAARGRDGDLFPWGGFWEADIANWGEQDVMRTSVAGKLDGHGWTSAPGSFPDGQSPYGLDDMAGNVAEWVRGDDELEGYVRGGSWISSPFEMRTTVRQARDVTTRRTDIGFRCIY